MAFNLIRQSVPSAGPVIMHTGMFLKSGDGTASWCHAERKLRLGLMSFLASQNLNRTKLKFWTEDVNHPALRALDPILADARYAGKVEVLRFDPAEQFAQVPGTDLLRETLMKLYNTDNELASKSDLQRIILLHNYGGVWVDTDVLLVNDFGPLTGDDWVYLGFADFINGALLSVSKPQSEFVRAYLMATLMTGLTYTKKGDLYRFGPHLLTNISKDAAMNSTFRVLPACFFDGGWNHVDGSTLEEARGAVRWDDFFTRPAQQAQISYITPGEQGSRLTFAYHWHGHWDVPIARGSLAEVAERAYIKRLGLAVPEAEDWPQSAACRAKVAALAAERQLGGRRAR